MEVAKTFNEKISRYCQVTLESCAYVGTGNVLKVRNELAEMRPVLDEAIKAKEQITRDLNVISWRHVLQWLKKNNLRQKL